MPATFPAGLQQSPCHSWREVHSAPLVERCSGGDKRDPLCAEWTCWHLQKADRTPAASGCSRTQARPLPPPAASRRSARLPILLGSGPSRVLFLLPRWLAGGAPCCPLARMSRAFLPEAMGSVASYQLTWVPRPGLSPSPLQRC